MKLIASYHRLPVADMHFENFHLTDKVLKKMYCPKTLRTQLVDKHAILNINIDTFAGYVRYHFLVGCEGSIYSWSKAMI